MANSKKRAKSSNDKSPNRIPRHESFPLKMPRTDRRKLKTSHSNSKRPREESSTKPPPKLRQIKGLEGAAKQRNVRFDPRFSSSCGQFDEFVRQDEIQQQRKNFELHSFASDVTQLAEELGLEFREERGRFVLILWASSPPADFEKENCCCSSSLSYAKPNEDVKWLVLADKQSTIRCSEYSRSEHSRTDTTGRSDGLLGNTGLVEGRKECWKKWGRVQFLRAVRSKCMQYFFGKKMISNYVC